MALVVFTGGARSGKSRAAAQLAARRELDGAPVHVCVFGRMGVDEEFDARIESHRRSRPASWSVTEVADPLAELGTPPEGGVLLVDCLGTAIGRLMDIAYASHVGANLADSGSHTMPETVASKVTASVDAMIADLVGRTHDTIVVTNEVGSGVVPAFASGRFFQDLLGSANARLVRSADAAYLCVAGRLVDLTGLPGDVDWPND